jgi:hypothetical protein
MQVGDEGAQIRLAVLISVLDQDYPALGHTGEGVAGIDNLRWPSLAGIIRGVIEFSASGEEGIYYFSPDPVYKIDLIPVQKIKRPALPPGQLIF